MLELDLDIERFHDHVPMARRKLAPDQHLYRAGQAFQSLYVVDVGILKTCELATDGREQVTGFRMSGDWIGLESIGLNRCRCDAVAPTSPRF